MDFDDDTEFIEEVEFIGKTEDPRKDKIVISPDKEVEKDFNRLFYEMDNLSGRRDKIITLHLYLDKSMSRIISLLNPSFKKWKFFKKVEYLENNGLIELDQIYNLKEINKLRNKYAHLLEIEKIEFEYQLMVEKLKLSGKVFANPHHDKFQLVIYQLLFELNSIYDNERVKRGEGTIQKGMNDEEIKNKLVQEGTLFWQFCKIINYEKEGYTERYELLCPFCGKGKIIRERDGTPGFKDSFFVKCDNCGLDGDGSTLELKK
jgi:predicted RNA-binding Zn-ribbon protein involved in translation (DUF1610 family)